MTALIKPSLKRPNDAFLAFLTNLIGVVALIFLLLSLLLPYMLARPVVRVAAVADAASVGQGGRRDLYQSGAVRSHAAKPGPCDANAQILKLAANAQGAYQAR